MPVILGRCSIRAGGKQCDFPSHDGDQGQYPHAILGSLTAHTLAPTTTFVQRTKVSRPAWSIKIISDLVHYRHRFHPWATKSEELFFRIGGPFSVILKSRWMLGNVWSHVTPFCGNLSLDDDWAGREDCLPVSQLHFSSSKGPSGGDNG